jgi:serine/threonine protein kinase
VGGALNILGKKVAAVAAAAREKQGRAKRRAERAKEKEARKKEKASKKAAAAAAAAAAEAAAASKSPKSSSKPSCNRPLRSAADAEASALRGAASHGCVVGVVGAWRSRRSLRGDLWLVMELCDGGSVADALALMGKKGGGTVRSAGKSSGSQGAQPLVSLCDVGPAGGLTEAAIARVVGGALAGIAHIHASGKAHRDIKCGNLLLTAKGDVKVADFGVAGKESFFFFGGGGGGGAGTQRVDRKKMAFSSLSSVAKKEKRLENMVARSPRSLSLSFNPLRAFFSQNLALKNSTKKT